MVCPSNRTCRQSLNCHSYTTYTASNTANIWNVTSLLDVHPFSRSRKVRCDSSRPTCQNCTRREDPCEYDVVLKRRGPDKQPGTRHRLYKKRPEGVKPPPKRVRQPRRKDSLDSSKQRELQGPQRTGRRIPEVSPYREVRNGEERGIRPLSPSTTVASQVTLPQRQAPIPPVDDDIDVDMILRTVGLGSLDRLLRLMKDKASTAIEETRDPGFYDLYHHWITSSVSLDQERVSTVTIYPRADGCFPEPVSETCIPRGPSSSFHKETWWDSLLSLYSDNSTQAALKVFQDLGFL